MKFRQLLAFRAPIALLMVLLGIAPLAGPVSSAGAAGSPWASAVPVPGLATLSGGGASSAVRISCVSESNGTPVCVATGSYSPASGVQQAFVADEVGGTWGAAQEIPGTGALNSSGFASGGSISCVATATGGYSCAVTGSYKDATGTHAFVADDLNGLWSTAQPIPGMSALSTYHYDIGLSVSCTTPGANGNNCAVTGTYYSGLVMGQIFVDDEVNGSWQSAVELPGTAALNLKNKGSGVSISCTTPGANGNNCAVTGNYTDYYTYTQSFVADEVNGTWQSAVEIPGTATLNTGHRSYGVFISCGTPGTAGNNCAATGYYWSATLVQQAFVADEVNGVWGNAIVIPGTLALNAGTRASGSSMSCLAPSVGGNNCAVTGYYTDAGGHTQAFVDDEINGTWSNAIEIPGTAALNSNGVAQGTSVSCVSTGAGGNNCGVTGAYDDAAYHYQSFVDDELNGVWQNAVETPGTSTLNLGSSGGYAVSCYAATGTGNSCGVAGYYTNSSSVQQAYVDNEVPTSVAASTPTVTNFPTSPVVGGSFTPVISTNGDGATSVTSSSPSVCTVDPTTGLVTFVAAGTCVLVAHVANGTNYTAADGAAQSFTVGQGTLYVVPDNQSITHGTTAPASTFYTFRYYADAAHTTPVTNVTPATAPTCTSAYSTTDAAGATDTITCSGGSDPNYVFDTSATATLDVTLGTIYAVPADVSLTYGSPVPSTFTLSYYSDAAHTTPVTPSVLSAPVCTTTYTPSTDVGTYSAAITCADGRATNDVIDASATATVTVTPATLYVVPSDQSLTVGTLSPSASFYDFTYYADAGHTQEVTSVPANDATTCHSTYVITANAGATFPITCTTTSTDPNYTLDVTATATLQVTPGTVYAVPSDVTLTYGSAAPTTADYVITYYSDPEHTQPLVGYAPTAAPTCTSPYTSTTDVGAYSDAITCEGGSDSNYVIDTSATAAVTVTPATLYVKADDQTITVGTDVPDDTFYTFQYFADAADTIPVDSSTSPTAAPACTSAYATTSPTGTLPITCSGGGDANYTIGGYVGATLTVQAQPVLYVVPQTVTEVYGAAAPTSYTYTYYSDPSLTTLVTPTETTPPTCTSSYSATTPVGTYANAVTCSGGAVSGDTLDTSATADLLVTPATPSAPTITNVPSSPTTGDAFAPIVATTGDGLTSVTSSTTTVCVVDPATGEVTFVGPGTCTLTAHVATGTNYASGDGSSVSVAVTTGPAVAPSITNLPDLAEQGGSFVPVVTTDSNGVTSVTSSTTSVCTVGGDGSVSYVGPGTCTLTAHVAASADYTAADGTAQSFYVYLGQATAPTITNLPSSATLGTTFTPVVSTNGDGTTTVTSSTPDVCVVDAQTGLVAFVGQGTCTLTAHVADGVNYLGNDGSTQSVNVGVASAGTPPPTTTTTTTEPTTLVAPHEVKVAPSGTTVTVTWAPVSGATSYVVTTQPSSGSCTTTGTQCELRNLTRGEHYVILVMAKNASGESPLASATTTIAPVRHLEVVPFAVDSAALDAHLRAQIDAIARAVVSGRYQNVTFIGYTDVTGDAAHNQTLSRERADAVAAYLKSELERLGESGHQLTTLGLGSAHPVVASDTTSSLTASRRVEVTLQ